MRHDSHAPRAFAGPLVRVAVVAAVRTRWGCCSRRVRTATTGIGRCGLQSIRGHRDDLEFDLLANTLLSASEER